MSTSRSHWNTAVLLGLSLLAQTLVVSCGPGITTGGGGDRIAEGSYVLEIRTAGGGGSRRFAGTTAYWIRDISTVTLGPEDGPGKLARVQLSLVEPWTVILSTTERREGDGIEIDGKIYQGEVADASETLRREFGTTIYKPGIVETGQNYIHGVWLAVMRRTLVNPEDTPETVEVIFEFRAIAR